MIPAPASRRRHRGTVLIITLFMLALLTVLIMAFLSNSLLNRQIDFSYANMVKADELSRSASEVIVGELRQEISDPSYSQSTNGGNAQYPISYQPWAATNLMPQPVAVSGSLATNIVKVSASGSPIDPGQNGRSLGSTVPITSSSLNGRYLTLDRWFGSGGPSLGTNGAMPTWVYVTRGGLQTPALGDAADPTKSGYVIGRFAYTVYDQGGLMDANVAGYPAVAAALAPYKSGLAFADVGGILGVTSLATWRNSASGADATNFNEWAAGLPPSSGPNNPSALAAAASGHMNAPVGDNAFFSRHDLLYAAQNSVAGLSPALVSHLTHFSRAANAPSWAPTTVSATNPDLAGGVRFASSGSITHYDDTALASTYPVLAGDPLIQRRFSLTKLTWLTSTGIRSGIPVAAVSACFGLTWNSDTEQWSYQDYPIKTLSQVASLGREPNFFELLKAGIATKSTGLAAVNATASDKFYQNLLDSNTDLQILRTGANIIAQVTTDNYPVTLTLPVAGVNVPVYGVKDLPYLNDVLATYLATVGSGGPTTNNMYYTTNLALVVVPQLFNPHALSPTPPTNGPTSLQIVCTSGLFSAIGPTTGLASGSGPLYRYGYFSPASTNVIIPSYDNANDPFRGAVTSVTTQGDPASAFTKQLPWISGYGDPFHGFVIYNYTNLTSADNYTTSTNNAGAPNYVAGNIRANISSDLIIEAQYKSPQGVYRTYDTLCGNDGYAATGSSGLGNASGTAGGRNNLEFDSAFTLYQQLSLNSPRQGWYCDIVGIYSKIDPRTSRCGIGYSEYWALPSCPTGNYTNFPTTPTTAVNGPCVNLPFGAGVSPANGIWTGLWPAGGKTGWPAAGPYTNVANVADVDNVVRPADGWLGANLFTNSFNTLGTNTEAAGRPVILGRPFRSVAELGYAFRDSPWKTLSFFDDTSGDGALLDLFSVSDEPQIVAGRVHLNSAQPSVQQALLSGVA
ncbi:MAG TPA: hypothetical protein VGC39_07210, partial [Candidatus Methylacidiphilales bacterium]